MSTAGPLPSGAADDSEASGQLNRAVSKFDDFLQQHIRSWRQGDDKAGRILISQLEELSSYIQRARLEVAALSLEDLQNTYIPSATDQLDAIVEMTAEATNRIMSAAESIEGIIAEGTPELRDRICEAATHIYEACAFQDITGQRVRKVVQALQKIETKIDALLWAFAGEQRAAGGETTLAKPEGAAAHRDSHLLEGPQLAGNAKSQAEIDALFGD
jgi:chemotaxis protein CheZ